MKRSLPGAPWCGRATWSCFSGLAATGALLLLLAQGCAGSLDPGVGTGGAVGGSSGSNGCETTILTSRCVPCHGTASAAAGLDLQSANVRARLVGQMGAATTVGGLCSTMTLLDSGSNPATGVFIDKITMTNPPCGLVMPYGGPLLPADQIACLTTWATGLTTAPAAFTGEQTP